MTIRWMACAFALLLGCSDGGGGGSSGAGGSGGNGGSGGQGGVGGRYASEDLWLCRPDIDNDRCDQADLSITEIRPDGTSVVDDVVEDPSAEVDCFYVYHTVDWRDEAGNMETLDPHPEDVVKALHRNGALYRGVCRMFAPLYRQMTIATYQFDVQSTTFFRKAYGDVLEAFEYYMRRHNEGRHLVLIGHSQGSQMLTKLLQDKFEDDEALRNRAADRESGGHGGRYSIQ